MTAIGGAIADAMITDMRATTLVIPCVFERAYVPRSELEDAESTVVSVVYAGQRAIPDHRSAWRHEYDVDVAVQRKVNLDDNEALDRCSDLLDALVDFWKTRKPTGYQANLIAIAHNPFVPEHLTEYKQFTGVVRMTFRMTRAN